MWFNLNRPCKVSGARVSPPTSPLDGDPSSAIGIINHCAHESRRGHEIRSKLILKTMPGLGFPSRAFCFMKTTSKKSGKKPPAKPRVASAATSIAKLKKTIAAQAREIREGAEQQAATSVPLETVVPCELTLAVNWNALPTMSASAAN